MKDDGFKKIESALYLPDSEASQLLTPAENERRKRWMYCVSQKMDDPLISDKSLIGVLTTGMTGQFSPVATSTAYRDLAAVSKLAGSIQLAAKNWYRYMIVEGAKKAYEIAMNANDGKGMAAALDKIGKYTMADKPDNEFDWDKMLPPVLEPSNDVTLLENIEPIENLEERRKELRSLFKSQMKESAIEINPEEEE